MTKKLLFSKLPSTTKLQVRRKLKVAKEKALVLAITMGKNLFSWIL